MRKKKRKVLGLSVKLVTSVATLFFFVALFSYLWDWITANRLSVIIVSALLLIIFLYFGWLSKSAIFRTGKRQLLG